MTTTIPSGLGNSWGIAQEGTVGTYTAPTRWLQIDKETMSLKKTIAQSVGLHQGLYQQTQRRAFNAHTVDGQVDMDVTDQQMGLLFKHAIGSGASIASVVSGASIQTHVPGDTAGLSLAIQKAAPETTGPGTIQSVSYNGCKITDWTLSVARDGLAKWSMNIDAWNEDMSQTYTAPSFVATNALAFFQGALTLGGTLSTSSGSLSVSAASTPTAVVAGLTIKGQNGLDTKRFTLGSTTKKEQFSNAFRKLTGTIDFEFANLTDYYQSGFYSSTALETPLAIVFTLTGNIITGATHSKLQTIVANAYFDTVPVVIEGPNLIQVKTTWTALDDAVNPVMQFQYTSADSVV